MDVMTVIGIILALIYFAILDGIKKQEAWNRHRAEQEYWEKTRGH